MLQAVVLTKGSRHHVLSVVDLREAIAAHAMGELGPCLDEEPGAAPLLEHVERGGQAHVVTDGSEPLCVVASLAPRSANGVGLRLHVLANGRRRNDLPAVVRYAVVSAEELSGDVCRCVDIMRECRFPNDRAVLEVSWRRVNEWRWEVGPLGPLPALRELPAGAIVSAVPHSPDPALLDLDVEGRINLEAHRYEPGLSAMATVAGQPCACILAHGTAGYLYVDYLFVAEAQRRSGIASALLARSLDAAQRLGLKAAVSCRCVGNQLVDGLLRRFGWRPVCEGGLQACEPKWR